VPLLVLGAIAALKLESQPVKEIPPPPPATWFPLSFIYLKSCHLNCTVWMMKKVYLDNAKPRNSFMGLNIKVLRPKVQLQLEGGTPWTEGAVRFKITNTPGNFNQGCIAKLYSIHLISITG
jgi:hypothetical protein